MEHELLHNESDYNLRLSNKGKKEKEKVDPGDRKKWNFRKPNSTMETVGNRSPSPTSGLINPSAEVLRSKRVVSPTMIFENKIDENDTIEQTELGSPPATINLPASKSIQQQMHTSPKSVNLDNQTTTPNSKKMRQKSLPLSTSPPLLIHRPQSLRKSSEIFHRQISAPIIVTPIPPSKPVYPQNHIAGTSEPFSQTPIQSDRSDVHRSVNVGDLPVNNQWKTIQQPLFTASDQLPNVVQDDINAHRPRPASEKDTPVGETMDETRKMMWQGNNQQEMMHGVNWTDFSSTTNEVFVPDDRAWAGAKNIAVEAEEINQDQSEGDASNSSRSSNSSDSGNEEETEESVWKINDEQRTYYLNQFRILQPAEKGVVTGQTARNFFLKSGLAKDVLSKIWNLADLDNDGALNFEEFCIAMHIVVAVRHGLEVPAALPHYLTPEQYEKQGPVASPPQTLETSNQEQLPLPEPSQAWARFSPDPQNTPQMVPPDDESTVAGQQVIQQSQPVGQQTHPVVQPTQPVVQPTQPVTSPKRHCERTMSDPSSSDEKSTKENTNQPVRKTSLGIPRVRGQSKQTNLLDTPHWAILPPPSKFTKEIPEEVNKGGLFVPTGTIIPADTERAALPKTEKVDRSSPRDSQSDSSSSEAEEPDSPKERPSSSTKDNVNLASSGSLSRNSSQSSVGENQDAVDGCKKPTAPVPPPRKRTGHSRSSSLDLQKLFNNKGGSASLQATHENGLNKKAKNTGIETKNDAEDNPANKGSPQASKNNQENFADFSKFENTLTTVHPTENINRHRRSASLDSTHAIWVEPSQPAQTQAVEVKDPSTTRHELTASLPRPVPKNKPASPPPPMRQKKDAHQDSGSDGMIEKEKKLSKEPIHFVVKPLTRLEQLHARIRDLKTKNTRLSRVNNELQQELKQMMEKRIGLESSLEQLKPFAK